MHGLPYFLPSFLLSFPCIFLPSFFPSFFPSLFPSFLPPSRPSLPPISQRLSVSPSSYGSLLRLCFHTTSRLAGSQPPAPGNPTKSHWGAISHPDHHLGHEKSTRSENDDPTLKGKKQTFIYIQVKGDKRLPWSGKTQTKACPFPQVLGLTGWPDKLGYQQVRSHHSEQRLSKV